MRHIAVAALLAVASPAWAAQGLSDNAVRIGVLTDMTGYYSDLAGPGSVLAANLAVEDFGKKVLGKPIEVISADHQNRRTSPRTPRAGGSTSSAWTSSPTSCRRPPPAR